MDGTLEMTAERVADAMRRVREVVAQRVVGQDQALDEALVAFLARGHALLEGVPGTAKTLLVRALSGALNARFGRIQFTPDLMPSDITGITILRDGGRVSEFHAGPIFTDLLLADEINRAPAKTQAALLEGMAERQVTVDGEARALGDLFTVYATQNPVEYEGTYPLPEAQLDRFLLKIRIGYPAREAELRILDNYAAGFDAERASDVVPPPVLSVEECRLLRGAADGVRVAPEVREYITAIVRATREDPGLTLGGSPRATVALFRVARAAALLAGRDFATPDDVKDYTLPVLRHRVMLAPELEVEGRTADEVLSALLARVAAPK
ncbi:MAG TPA: MoxR family ATPase [Gemmatimonadaceae bacterium]|nr:MoxR family ATPase [Gemmatimonadaceae bacterium]